MKRIASWCLATCAILAVAGLLLTWWARPEWFTRLRQLALPESLFASRSADVLPEPTEPEASFEMVEDGWCKTHRQPIAWCASAANPEAASRECQPATLPLIRLSSPRVADRIGLASSRVVSRTHADRIQGNAEIAYNDHVFAEVRPRVRGLVNQVAIDHGDLVKRGDLIATIDSAEVGTVKAGYLAALPDVELAEATLTRTEALTRSNALPLKDELEARTTLNRARADLLNAAQQLRNLGFVDSDLVRISEEQDTSSLLHVLAPIDGTITERHAVPGEAVEPTHQLAVIVDLTTMWAMIDVYEDEIDRVRPGQPVSFEITGIEDHTFSGHVDWIDSAVNPTTRTIQVRALLDNPDRRLRAHEFGIAEIQVGEPREALFVPRTAIQNIDEDLVVFIAQPDGSYRPQRIVVEKRNGLEDEAEVLWGLDEGQQLITTGAFLLKSELLKDQLAVD